MGWRVSLSKSAFKMLERYAVKVARTVLRGGSGSNAIPLPDHADGWIRTAKMVFFVASVFFRFVGESRPSSRR